MKLYISKGKYGWYTIAKNYKDKEDKKYVNLFFPKNTDPAENVECIKPIEWALDCYKGNVGMTIFKYECIDENNDMGGDRAAIGKDVGIEPNDLPFF